MRKRPFAENPICAKQSDQNAEEQVAGKTMKALVLRKHGTLDDLEVVTDHPVPQASEGHVVIRVRASSFNYHDVFTVRGMPVTLSKTPGTIRGLGPELGQDTEMTLFELLGYDWDEIGALKEKGAIP